MALLATPTHTCNFVLYVQAGCTIGSKVVYTLVCICMCVFLVRFVKDETWLNVGTTKTLMKAPLCVKT